MSQHSDKPLILVPGPVRGASEAADRPERRRAVRYPITATAEVVELRSQTRVLGRSSDLSLGGCYVDTFSPLAVGAIVRVRLECEQRLFEALATVSNAHPSMGMGLAFTEIKPEHQAILQVWVAELSGERPAEPAAKTTEPDSEMPSTLLNLQQVLNELVNLMVRKKIINETEGTALLRKLFR
jgi:hypothetical protein